MHSGTVDVSVPDGFEETGSTMDRPGTSDRRPSGTGPGRTARPRDLQPWLADAVDRLVHKLDPEQIVLFGSYARATATRRSDIDLCLVWDTDLGPFDRIGTVLRLLKDAPRPVEPVAYTPEERARLSTSPSVRRIFDGGVMLYERGDALG